MEHRAVRWGAGLVAAGALLLAAWAILEFTPLGRKEEPASPGKTPNPSQSPWNKPIPPWEYSLAYGLVILIDTVLPAGGSLALGAGLSLLLAQARPRSGHSLATALLGSLVLVGGLSLLATTFWQWHVRTARIEPACPGSTPSVDRDSPFFGDLAEWTPEKARASLEESRRKDRLDRLWGRILLTLFPPLGLLLAATGLWLLSARSNRD